MKRTLLFFFGFGMALTGCSIHTRSSDTMAATVHASSESYMGGLVERTDEVVTSRVQGRECITDRRLEDVARGYIISVDNQGSCYRQTTDPYIRTTDGRPVAPDPRGASPVVTVPVYPGVSSGGGLSTGAPGVWR